MIHDDHLADHIRTTFPPVTTASVDQKTDAIIAEFEQFKRDFYRWAVIAAAGITLVGIGVLLLAVTR